MTDHPTLTKELTLAENALASAVCALVQATERYCATFPEEVRRGLPSYASSKSNASAAYYMYVSALSYIIQAIEAQIARLSPLSEKALLLDDRDTIKCCQKYAESYESFTHNAMSPYFEQSQHFICGNGETVSLSPLYSATCEFLRHAKQLANHWKKD